MEDGVGVRALVGLFVGGSVVCAKMGASVGDLVGTGAGAENIIWALGSAATLGAKVQSLGLLRRVSP